MTWHSDTLVTERKRNGVSGGSRRHLYGLLTDSAEGVA